jgi:hypothetical protein
MFRLTAADPPADQVRRIPMQTAGFRYQRFGPSGLDGDHLYAWIEGGPYTGERPHAHVELTFCTVAQASERLASEPELAAAVQAGAAAYQAQDERAFYAGTVRSLTSRQIWQSVDGQQPGLLQIVQRPNQKLPWGPTPPAISGNPSDWTSLPATSCPGAAPPRGTYAFLTTLPTDPGRLRSWIYQHPDGELQRDMEAWTDIGDILREMLVPPKLAAALFRVAATIPGATVLPHAVNATGQSGVAVSRSGAELIFNPRTYQLIGEGAVLTKAVAGEGPAGTVIADTAQQRARVVSSLPDIPKSQVDQSQGGVSC